MQKRRRNKFKEEDYSGFQLSMMEYLLVTHDLERPGYDDNHIWFMSHDCEERPHDSIFIERGGIRLYTDNYASAFKVEYGHDGYFLTPESPDFLEKIAEFVQETRNRRLTI